MREALQFSAIMRQSSNSTRREKLVYVDDVIKILEMDVYADAIVKGSCHEVKFMWQN